jgi:hypothetical protein
MSQWLDIEDLDGAWDRLDGESRNAAMLWRAVIAQSVRDLASIDTGVAFEAAVWLGTDDYRDVCELALLEPISLEQAIRLAVQGDNPLYRKARTNALSDKLTAWPSAPSEEEAA